MEALTKEARNTIHEALVAIAEDLMGRAIETEQGIHWETMSLGPDSMPIFHVTDGVYGGTAGIGFFFNELNKLVPNEQYARAALEAARWLVHYTRETPIDYYALVTGRLGVGWWLSQMHAQYPDEGFMERAVEIGLEAADAQHLRGIDDFINGRSGTLLGLLHIYAASGDERLLTVANHYAEVVLGNALFGKEGLCWDRTEHGIRALNGFSHGAGGIGHVFLELSRFTGNKAFEWLATQAFLYEDESFDKEEKNWPDWRCGSFDEETEKEHSKAYQAGDLPFFHNSRFMSAWCHGAPGIGLARLRAYELMGSETQLQQAQYAAENTIQQIEKELAEDTGSFSLCHASGGNAMLLLQASKVLPAAPYMSLVNKLAMYLAEYRRKGGTFISGFGRNRDPKAEDTSLFMGNAGAGYFLLNALYPGKPVDVLSFSLQAAPMAPEVLEKFPVLTMNLKQLMERVLQSRYQQTMAVYKHWAGEAAYDRLITFTGNEKSLVAAFETRLQQAIAQLPEGPKAWVADVAALEGEVVHMEASVTSFAYLFRQQTEEYKRWSTLKESQDLAIDGVTLKMNPNAKVVDTAHNWALENEDQLPDMEGAPETPTPFLLWPTFLGVKIFRLNDFSRLVLECFITPTSVAETLDKAVEAFGVEAPEQVAQVKAVTREQIITSLDSNMLFIA